MALEAIDAASAFASRALAAAAVAPLPTALASAQIGLGAPGSSHRPRRVERSSSSRQRVMNHVGEIKDDGQRMVTFTDTPLQQQGSRIC